MGENAAADYVRRLGFRIWTRNYRKPYGEMDIVAEKDGIIRFIEVKTSIYHPDPAFLPEARVNPRKMRVLRKLCAAYLAEVRVPEDQEWQIDVISVILDGSVAKKIELFENAVFARQY